MQKNNFDILVQTALTVGLIWTILELTPKSALLSFTILQYKVTNLVGTYSRNFLLNYLASFEEINLCDNNGGRGQLSSYSFKRKCSFIFLLTHCVLPWEVESFFFAFFKNCFLSDFSIYCRQHVAVGTGNQLAVVCTIEPS